MDLRFYYTHAEVAQKLLNSLVPKMSTKQI